ncbi:sodium/hydrogen exchanger 9B2-like isoform X1 [Euwallacea fornicatus]|uniref:sodium/hydrogen exchanger 9B2-like isoform X1 n=1 Tax=Euwallacea fornicatus TaxID=995702 RepID=UPI00338E30DE
MPGDQDLSHLKSNSTPGQPESNHQVRRVSIVDNLHDRGYDNHAFDSPARNRKPSGQTDHAEVGPVRKKSILHVNSVYDKEGRIDSGHRHQSDVDPGNGYKKHSTTESLYSKSSTYSQARKISQEVNEGRTWWYAFFQKCWTEEEQPTWQPPFWPKLCPSPYCPSYRQFSRLIALILIGLLAWIVLYSLVRDIAAPPHGILYQLLMLSIGAYIGGWLMSLTSLPALIGMLFTGVLLQNVGAVDIDETFTEISKVLREFALVMILTRAGLDLDPHALKRLKFPVLKISVIPFMVEIGVTAVLAKYLLSIPWDYSILLGSAVGAVSPAVIVPCLFRLRSKGYGVAKGIPTLIIAVAGIDDASSVAVFGIIKTVMFSDSSVTELVMQGLSVVVGIGFGAMWGIICNYTPEKHDPFMVPLRILMLLAGGTVTLFGSELIGYGGAGPLACVATAFTCIVCWTRQGWDIEDNPAATAFEIFWMLFEPIVFGVTGAQVKFSELDGSVIGVGIGILVVAFLLRQLATVLVSVRCNYNMKEKVFIAFSLMAKATVQAALAGVALSEIKDESSAEYGYAKKVMMVCILSIIVTAPTGAILISVTGPRLLTKTKVLNVPEGWRRSHRPSIRDISIIDEEEERDDVESVAITVTPDNDSNHVSNNKSHSYKLDYNITPVDT